MSWKHALIRNFRLYAVTDIKEVRPDIINRIEAAYEGGTDIVQLRSKTLSDRVLYDLGLRIREIAERKQRLFFINDRLDLAIAVGAHGLHIGQDDLPVNLVREIISKAGTDLFLGKSTHSLDQALAASQEEVDYIGLGPVFSTPTKPDYEAIGPDIIKAVSESVKKPFVVIGGIDETNIQKVLEGGARRVAAVRAIFQTGDTYEAARQLRNKIEEYPL